MTRMFLIRVQGPPRVHGVNYRKGLEDGRECGRVHEFHTRCCKPVAYTEEQAKRFALSTDELVELEPFLEQPGDGH